MSFSEWLDAVAGCLPHKWCRWDTLLLIAQIIFCAAASVITTLAVLPRFSA